MTETVYSDARGKAAGEIEFKVSDKRCGCGAAWIELSAYPINPRNALFSGKNRVIRIGTYGK